MVYIYDAAVVLYLSNTNVHTFMAYVSVIFLAVFFEKLETLK